MRRRLLVQSAWWPFVPAIAVLVFFIAAVVAGLLPQRWRTVACAIVLIAAAVQLLIGVIRNRRRALIEARLAGGCCPVCGYDLRTKPHRCPECGIRPKSRSKLQWLRS